AGCRGGPGDRGNPRGAGVRRRAVAAAYRSARERGMMPRSLDFWPVTRRSPARLICRTRATAMLGTLSAAGPTTIVRLAGPSATGGANAAGPLPPTAALARWAGRPGHPARAAGAARRRRSTVAGPSSPPRPTATRLRRAGERGGGSRYRAEASARRERDARDAPAGGAVV